MEHKALIINHRLESFVYADTAARTGAIGFVAGDVGRISYQTDTGQYWRLLSQAAGVPTWALIGPPSVLPVYASLQTSPASPAAVTTATPGIMAGLGGAAHITPTATGKILVAVSGTLSSYVASKAVTANLRYGTGTGPAYGAGGTTGTQLGGSTSVFGGDAIETSGFSLCGVLTGMALGTAVWFDLQVYVDSGGNGQALTVAVSAVELP